MKLGLVVVLSLLLSVLLSVVSAQTPEATQRMPATLAGHALIPALTMVPPPPDAPRETWISGKFTGPGNLRNDQPMSVMGNTGPLHGNRETGIRLPFLGQPLQGFSGLAMNRAPDGSLYALIDNGFGNRRNSPDALLFFTRLVPDWQHGGIEVRETVFLRDPDRVIPFRIVNDGTAERYLTGADFDPESIQVIGETVWIGEEFGPFLIRATLDGRVTGLFPAQRAGREIRSPDHPALVIPAAAGRDWVVPRSAGFEGMALHPESGMLWAMIERPLLGEDGQPEGRFVPVLEFDPRQGTWTGREFKFRIEEGATAIGDFNFIDSTRALVIERDNGEGDPSLACENPQAPRPDCFPLPALFKRVVLIDTAQVDAEGFVRKIAYIDLMDIQDPDGIARLPTAANRDLRGKFTFPFFTIENVMAVDEAHIVVAVDNNLPFSSGRQLDRAADNEFILLRVPELLAAR
jgi:hypothetical protein